VAKLTEMSQSIKIVFIKQGKNEQEGTLAIRTIINRKPKRKTLSIKLTQSQCDKYFNPEKQRFRSNKLFPLAEEYNNIIEKRLKELENHGNEIDNIPSDKKSFIKFWRHCIKNFTNHGTKIKHETILKKLVKYISLKNKTEDLLFKEITSSFLKEFRHHLTTVSTPKILSENSVIHYLKVMKSIINQSAVEDYYTYVKSPFDGLKFSAEKKLKAVLIEEEINRLFTTPITDIKIKETKDMFLYQIFSNGMRVSDLFLCRWNNIINDRLKYTMFKTGTEISIPLNLNLCIILSNYLDTPIKYESVVKKATISFQDEDSNFYDIGLNKLNRLIEYIQTPLLSHPYMKKSYYTQKKELDKNMGKTVLYKGYDIEVTDLRIKNYIDLRENLISQIENEFILQVSKAIKKEKEKRGTDFIFPVLSNELFKTIPKENDFSKISIEQYNSIKHHTIVYNRKLKKMQQLCEIETNITSHVSRHSYTNLLLRLDNVNLYDISQSLGHSSIKITENYLRNGFNIEKMDYLNNSISKKYGKSN
jgi:integrase